MIRMSSLQEQLLKAGLVDEKKLARAKQEKTRKANLARKQRGMTRYEFGQTADVPSTVGRAIEQGDGVPLSQFRAVAAALGLAIELMCRRLYQSSLRG